MAKTHGIRHRKKQAISDGESEALLRACFIAVVRQDLPGSQLVEDGGSLKIGVFDGDMQEWLGVLRARNQEEPTRSVVG